MDDFDLQSAFDRIDVNNKKSITHKEITLFLLSNSVTDIKSTEAKKLISFYDVNQDGKLDFKELN
jgi:Ca2+-binding EF-hand superfamily protein